jgi:drug/metabolite transporter (DMT)-like permease
VKPLGGYLSAVLSAVVLSFTSILISFLSVNWPMAPLVLAFWRCFFAALLLLPAFLFRSGLMKIRRGDIVYLILYGLLLAVFNSLWIPSVQLNGAAVATVLLYCSAAFSALLGWYLFKEVLGLVKITVVVLVLAGCFLVSGAMNGAAGVGIPGLVIGIFSGLGYAGYALMGRGAAVRGLDPWTTLFFTLVFSSVFLLLPNLLPLGLVPGNGDLLVLGSSLSGWGLVLLLAAGPTVLGYELFNISLVTLPSSVTNVVVSMEPAFTAVSAYLLLGERLGPPQIVGGVLILGGVVLLRLAPKTSNLSNESAA